MKRLSVTGLALTSAFLLGACESDEPTVESRHRGGYRPTQDRVVVEEAPVRETVVEEDAEPAPQPAPSETRTDTAPAPTTSKPPEVGNYDYGKAVPGKPGFVTSPYAPYSGYVDVRGFPPGTEVKDPYTGKIFLVP